MAGGSAADIRSKWPKGDDALIPIVFGPHDIEASGSADFVMEKRRMEFAFKPVRAELTSREIVISNALTLNLVDDSSSPNEIVTNQAPAAVTKGAGALEAITLAVGATAQQINAGAVLIWSYGSAVSDTALDVVFTLWVRPVN